MSSTQGEPSFHPPWPKLRSESPVRRTNVVMWPRSSTSSSSVTTTVSLTLLSTAVHFSTATLLPCACWSSSWPLAFTAAPKCVLDIAKGTLAHLSTSCSKCPWPTSIATLHSTKDQAMTGTLVVKCVPSNWRTNKVNLPVRVRTWCRTPLNPLLIQTIYPITTPAITRVPSNLSKTPVQTQWHTNRHTRSIKSPFLDNKRPISDLIE